MKTDYLIIGQGIAGTLFSYELAKRGQDFIIIDPNGHNASKTAAGMYNPVVLKRFSPVWNPIYRVFHNDDEKQTWRKKADDEPLCELLDTQFIDSPNEYIKAPNGLGKVNFGGRVHLEKLLADYRQKLSVENKIRTELFDYNALQITDNYIEYNDITAKKVVFCEGYGIKQNPFFNHLPLNGNKGEVMTVRVPNLQLNVAIKSKVFIMPTDSGKSELLEKLQSFVSGDIEVLEHRAGVRPTIADRRPLLGQHSDYPSLYILNGLGTRGVMLGATMAKQLYDFIENSVPLDPVVNIKRFEDEEK